MLVLDYVNVGTNGAVLEGRYLSDGQPHSSFDVIVSMDGRLMGRISHEDGSVVSRPEREECVALVRVLNPPRHVMKRRYVESSDGDVSSPMYVRMPALLGWIKLTLGAGVHEYTNEYEVAYAR